MALRRLAIAAQGYTSRSRRGTRPEVEETIRALSCVQLDSITAVERSHRIDAEEFWGRHEFAGFEEAAQVVRDWEQVYHYLRFSMASPLN